MTKQRPSSGIYNQVGQLITTLTYTAHTHIFNKLTQLRQLYYIQNLTCMESPYLYVLQPLQRINRMGQHSLLSLE